MGLRDRIRRLESRAGLVVLVDIETGREFMVSEDADLRVLAAAWAKGMPTSPELGDFPDVARLLPLAERGVLLEKSTGEVWPYFT